MNVFESVKMGVSMTEAAEMHGVTVNRSRKALCPFHNPLLRKTAKKKALPKSYRKHGCETIMSVPRAFLTAFHRRSFGRIPMERRIRRCTIIADWNKDEWSGFADLMANLIEKYAAVPDVENLPEPPICLDNCKSKNVNKSKHFADAIEMDATA